MTDNIKDSTFASLGLREAILQTLASLGYEAPTPIQERTIPILLAGRDLIGQAQTGTGKTAAFALPILQKVDPEKRETQALVLTPTRELAMQVAEAIHTYAHSMPGLSVLPVYGGAPIVHQLKRLQRGVQIVVGTPGRLIDHLDRKSLRLDNIRIVVLDEADEMLKMGFIEDVERILSEAPSTRQIALFSATMPPEVVRIARKHMANAERVEIEHKSLSAPLIDQRFLNVSEGSKLEALTQMLELEESDATLIFRRTKNGAAELTERLVGRGFAAVAMHGDMKQAERESVIRRLRAGQIEIVVATDVAARGLDVEQITHVVNYDIPHDVEAYVHRIGRTGRAGRTGTATLFITPRERRMMREIEKFTKTSIKPMKMPTQADVAARRITQLKDTLRKTIQDGELDLYMQLIEQMVEEGPHDITEIAAAAARLASTTRPIAETVSAAASAPAYSARSYNDGDDTEPRQKSFSSARTMKNPPPSERAERTERAQFRDSATTVRLSMAVGKRDGIRPADVVGSIANEADIPGRDIGPIDIREDVTYVSVPAEVVEQVLEKVGTAKFKGRAVNIRVAGENEGNETRPPARPRADFRPADDRSFVPREGGRFTAKRPPFKRSERPSGGAERPSKPTRPYERASRPQGDRPYARPDAARSERGPRRDDRPRPAGARASSYSGGRESAGGGGRPPAAKGGAFSRYARPDRSSPKNDRGGPKGKRKPKR